MMQAIHCSLHQAGYSVYTPWNDGGFSQPWASSPSLGSNSGHQPSSPHYGNLTTAPRDSGSIILQYVCFDHGLLLPYCKTFFCNTIGYIFIIRCFCCDLVLLVKFAPPFFLSSVTPSGVNRHFHMICIRDKFSQNIGRQISSKVIWDHLSTMYDMQALVSAASQEAEHNRLCWCRSKS